MTKDVMFICVGAGMFSPQKYTPRSKLYMQYVISTSCSRVSPGLSFPEKNVLCLSVLLTSLSVTKEQRHFNFSIYCSSLRQLTALVKRSSVF